MEGTEADHRLRHQADLLVAFAARRSFRLLAFVDAPGRQLPEPLVHRGTVLPNQDHRAGTAPESAPPTSDGGRLDRHLALVWKRDLRDFHREHSAFEDDRHDALTDGL